MTPFDIARQRLDNQRIARTTWNQPAEVVAWLGAVQAQDYASARWAVGLRCVGATDASMNQALVDRSVIRTWALRGTLHLIATPDIRWILALVAPPILARTAATHRKLELDERAYRQIDRAVIKALQGDKQLTRKELFAALHDRGISTTGYRGSFILYHEALIGRICLGAMRGKQTTYTLLDEWAPKTRILDRDEALGGLASRYFNSRGPATLRDFAWWSGLAVADARLALEIAKGSLCQETILGQSYWLPQGASTVGVPSHNVHLLPGYDEYFIGYADRSAAVDPIHLQQLILSNGIFKPMMVVNGRVEGTWTRTVTKGAVVMTPMPFTPLMKTDSRAFAEAARRYGAFLNLPVTVE